MKNTILEEDLAYIFSHFEKKSQFKNAVILVTGCAGFIGFYLMNFLSAYCEELKIKKIIGLDNFSLGKPRWLEAIRKENPKKIAIHPFNIARDDLSKIKDAKSADFIIHMASIASPSFYRKYPIETVDANVWGLRRLLDFYRKKNIKGFLFFSSSETYGDPHENFIPTKEDYKGYVAAIGPRACYDESKRFGETLCYLFAKEYKMPVTIVRPFNNYGPGMKRGDKRVVPDFIEAVFNQKNIVMFSDGTPTRTFCYIRDALAGYLSALTFGTFEYFNIGIEKPEISMRELAEMFAKKGKEIMGYKGRVTLGTHTEKEYLTHNPSRRCPDLQKSRSLLGYRPEVEIEEGIERFLLFTKHNKGLL